VRQKKKKDSVKWPILGLGKCQEHHTLEKQRIRNVFMCLYIDLEKQIFGSEIRIKQLFSIIVLVLNFVSCLSLNDFLHSDCIVFFPWTLYVWWEFAVINIVSPISLIKCCFIYSLVRMRLTVMK